MSAGIGCTNGNIGNTGSELRNTQVMAPSTAASWRRPPPSHIHARWMVSATRTPTSSAPSQDYLFPLYMWV
jgi:hypothetical protein